MILEQFTIQVPKTVGRGRAQQRVAQYHGEQNIGVEDGDQHRGFTINLAVLRAWPLEGWCRRGGCVCSVCAPYCHYARFAPHIVRQEAASIF